MTENPFGQAGGDGGLDLNALMKQAQEMQAGMEKAQADLAEVEVDGTSSGGAITVTMTALGEVRGIKIAPGQVDGSDQESLDDLGDLIVAAFQDARANAEVVVREKMGPFTEGMPGLGDGGPVGFQ